MIEITAKLMRTEGGIYATGERLECLIEFRNKSPNQEDVEGNASTSQLENLAWASMQIHCYRKTSQNLIVPVQGGGGSSGAAGKPFETNQGLQTGKTSLDTVTPPLGDIIYASKPKILFCDLKLAPNESKSYVCAENLPRDGPPTYRGHDIKYFYRLIIATQRVKSKIQTLIIPIRVLPIPIIARPEELTITEETNVELAPTNPFLEKRELNELEMSWHHLKNITARRAPKFYRISNKNGCVAHFCLFKPSYKLGEDIVGSLDFSKGSISCLQFLVKLQSVEMRSSQMSGGHKSTTIGQKQLGGGNPLITGDAQTALTSIHPSLMDANSVTSTLAGLEINSTGKVNSQQLKNPVSKVKTPQQKSPAVNDGKMEREGKVTTHVTSHEMSYALLKTEVVLNIPLHLTPCFSDDLIELRYRLHFEFVISKKVEFDAIQHYTTESEENKMESVAIELRSPNEISVETMIWDLPITVYATNPLQIYVPPQTHQLLIK